jgi:hypothetical protein
MFGLSGRRALILLVLLSLIFAASRYFPPYFAAFQFNDFVREEVKYAGTSRKTVDAIRTEILQKAGELGIPITKKDIRILRRGAASFTVEIDYRWPIDMKVYRHELVFHTSHSGELIENASD